jgi:hypothetical protein
MHDIMLSGNCAEQEGSGVPDSRQQTTDDRQQTAYSRPQTADNRQQIGDSRHQKQEGSGVPVLRMLRMLRTAGSRKRPAWHTKACPSITAHSGNSRNTSWICTEGHRGEGRDEGTGEEHRSTGAQEHRSTGAQGHRVEGVRAQGRSSQCQNACWCCGDRRHMLVL